MKRLLTFGAIGVLALAGCGSSSSSSSSSSTSSSSTSTGANAASGAQQLNISADPQQLKFNTNHLSAKAGKITITMSNPSPLQHDVSIKGGVNAQGNIVGQGGKSVVTVTLSPGKYTFYCSVDGHEVAGMNGELDVS